MWRNNVLGLRQCSSTTFSRHGVNRWYSSERSLPVSGKEFEHALTKVFRWRTGVESKQPLGFAISGGVDSMALATLYNQAQKANQVLPKAHGFIVDHKVRPESTEEAEWVAEQLRRNFDMEATVLSLTWPEDFDPFDLKRFETEARTLRYQALGRACKENRINMLMVAHHGDDQAETVMMRLANNRLRSGLQAMQSVEWIPECEGIYGVHHSGKKQKSEAGLNIPFPVERGGIQILRPLLGFEKSRLIATCEEKNIPWAEDKTNQIQTVTSRNAIRHIYRNHKLPEALSIKSLVDISLNMQNRVESHRSYARKLFDKCLIKLDIQTGSLLVRFPPVSALLGRRIETELDKSEAKDNAYCLVERVAELVTPKSKPQLGQLAVMIEHIYPELENDEHTFTDADMKHFKKNRCVYGVWWRFWDKPSPFTGVQADGHSLGVPHPREWFLTRQPLDRGERDDPDQHMIFPPSRTVSLTARTSSKIRETYRLFDGRFWIRLRNLTDDTLVLRIFQKEDLRYLPTAQEEKEYLRASPNSYRPERFISAAFSLLKPSDLRFTLPAVFRKSRINGEEELVGFPTLDVRMNGFGPSEGVCDWSVRYKKVDFGSRNAGDIIVPGSSRVDIIAEEKRYRMQNKGIARLKVQQGKVADDQGSDAFTGFKRGSDKKKKPRIVARSAAKQKGMQGEDFDGLDFLMQESQWQGNKKKGR